jgi:predicted membrane-bound spermidine synthase
MALVWSKRVNGTNYEVRCAGRTRRLYTDGVFHSQYNPARCVSGSVWDLLFIPAFFLPAGQVRRILLLGVGGGTVVKQLLRFTSARSIVGIEINPVHLYVARRFFGLDDNRLRLVEGDAIAWIKSYKGPPFDLIIDDLFGGRNAHPQRAVTANAAWFNTLHKHLCPGGALVVNFVSYAELKKSAWLNSLAVRRRFANGFCLSTPATENAVGAFLKTPATSAQMRARLKQQPCLATALRRRTLRYRIRSLTGPV